MTCHGATGGGPNEETIADDPSHDHGANADLLTGRVKQQRDGDLFDSITSGVPGTDMPAYDQALSDDDRWDLVNYVHAIARGRRVRLYKIIEPDIAVRFGWFSLVVYRFGISAARFLSPV